MPIADALWNLAGQKDLSVVQQRYTITAAGAAPSFSFTFLNQPPGSSNVAGEIVEKDRVFVVNSIMLDTIPGAGQQLVSFAAFITDVQTGTNTHVVAGDTISNNFAIAHTKGYNGGGDSIIVPPGYRLDVNVRFNAGGAANSVTCSLVGLRLPRAGLQS